MIKKIITITFLILATTGIVSQASETSLLFIGEDMTTMTIASRRAESPDNAPAVANVIARKEIEEKGFKSLAEVLSTLPGYYISPLHSGSVPYTRGLPNSTLFLYDSVHLTSDAAGSISPLDNELSLANVDRIEVINGPGSVLWGPDAFAGIVNIVPRRGRDIDGFELSAFGNEQDKEAGASLIWGRNTGLWESFLSLNADSLQEHHSDYNINQLTNSEGMPLSLSTRMGDGSVNRSKYLEAVINFSWQNWLRLSGRWSDAHREYVLEGADTELRWPAIADSPTAYLRLELEKKFTSSSLRLNTYYNVMEDNKQELDFPLRNQRSQVIYSELLFDKELWETDGLLTLGASSRYNRINGAGVSKAYLPDFFESESIAFFPRPQQTDFSTNMFDVFGQLKRQWNHIGLWCGLRLTNHSEYQVTTRPNAGLAWSPSSQWKMKLLYGTSFRTPYARQLIGRDDLEPEEIENISANLSWHPSPSLRFAATAFWNQIDNLTTQDPYYGGLSDPTAQDILGTELEATWDINSKWNLQTNATYFTHKGDNETYTYYAYTLEDGKWQLKPWVSWNIPYETGPNFMANVILLWKPTKHIDCSLKTKYESSWDFFYAKGGTQENIPAKLQVDTTAMFREISAGVDLQLSITNLTNNTNKTRGTYGPIDLSPFNAYMLLRWKL